MYPSAPEIISALRLIAADFDQRPTYQVVGKGGKTFEFFPTAITDNIPPLHPDLSRAVSLLSRLHLEHAHHATVGVGEEDRGAMIISDILLALNLPRTLARWTPSGAPGEVQVSFSNEYQPEGQAQIYLNGIKRGDRVLLIDDLISTGGTLLALIQAIEQTGATILEILTVGEKIENDGRTFLYQNTGHKIKTMLSTTLEMENGRAHSKLVQFHLGHLPEFIFHDVAQAFPPGQCRLGS